MLTHGAWLSLWCMADGAGRPPNGTRFLAGGDPIRFCAVEFIHPNQIHIHGNTYKLDLNFHVGINKTHWCIEFRCSVIHMLKFELSVRPKISFLPTYIGMLCPPLPAAAPTAMPTPQFLHLRPQTDELRRATPCNCNTNRSLSGDIVHIISSKRKRGRRCFYCQFLFVLFINNHGRYSDQRQCRRTRRNSMFE